MHVVFGNFSLLVNKRCKGSPGVPGIWESESFVGIVGDVKGNLFIRHVNAVIGLLFYRPGAVRGKGSSARATPSAPRLPEGIPWKRPAGARVAFSPAAAASRVGPGNSSILLLAPTGVPTQTLASRSSYSSATIFSTLLSLLLYHSVG